MGLYKNACKCLIKSEENPNPVYDLNEDDEIWFIVDTDKWGGELATLREKTAEHNNWFVGQSNPCFEVWLYYHFEKEKPNSDICNWKSFLNDKIKGGFNLKEHPKFIQDAIVNSELNFSLSSNQPDVLSTEVFLLGKKSLPLVESDIDSIL